MRLSRLHVLLILIAAGVGSYVVYKQKEMASTQAQPPAVKPPPARRPVLAPAQAPTSAPVASVPSVPPGPVPAAAVSSAIDHYTVSKGETLWAIARDHSPAQAGPAWVGIWKANKKIIKDFDHLDGGITLFIPQKRQAYVTAFWKPKHFQTAKDRRDVDLVEVFRNVPAVDVAELPIPWSDMEVDVAELPLPEGAPEYEFAVTAFRSPVPPLIPYR